MGYEIMINENPLTEAERGMIEGITITYGDPQPRKRSEWFRKLLSSIEAEQRRRLRHKHRDIIAAVSMGLVDNLWNSIPDDFAVRYLIGERDISAIVDDLVSHGVLRYRDALTYILVVTSLIDADE